MNVGSGSGYLSCLVSYMLGPSGLCHGIDINEEVVQHSRQATTQWISKQKTDPTSSLLRIGDSIHYISGNCFDIDILYTVNCCKYDRIYVGAACPSSRQEFFYSMLADGGILVLPVTELSQLVMVKRHAGAVYRLYID